MTSYGYERPSPYVGYFCHPRPSSPYTLPSTTFTSPHLPFIRHSPSTPPKRLPGGLVSLITAPTPVKQIDPQNKGSIFITQFDVREYMRYKLRHLSFSGTSSALSNESSEESLTLSEIKEPEETTVEEDDENDEWELFNKLLHEPMSYV
ncbi:hypothetical protein TrLO_g15226 [Triparma laevis f. longispina]|uniref:Uncharacterized protein n=1 Tax=Triparma laevis f. longispina TaxID=1714387 RepID=A0A9W7E0I3_9STRA|nr:hypothetical protein TrLO_g15226 [Triparma laevis f. longispina]